jgi:hypothetical protein
MIDSTKKLNILSLEELKGEIKSEKKETESKSENFFIERSKEIEDKIKAEVKNETEKVNPENFFIEKKKEIKKETIKISPKNSFIENKKKEKKESPKKLEPNKDLKQINKTKNQEDIIRKTGKTKNTEKIYINIQEASKISGLSRNTIRKSLKSNELSYFFEKGKYSVDMENFLKWIFQSQRKINIIKTKGIGKYIQTWKI